MKHDDKIRAEIITTPFVVEKIDRTFRVSLQSTLESMTRCHLCGVSGSVGFLCERCLEVRAGACAELKEMQCKN